jgi:pimeloyl-ACP methyl ester carboxylesterase
MYLQKTDEGVAETDKRRSDPTFVESQIARGLDAFEKSGRGLADELTLLATSTGESPAGLTCPIAVWHGRENDWVPFEESIRHFQNHPTSELHIVENAGTFLPASIYDEMIRWVVAQWRERGESGCTRSIANQGISSTI